MVYTVESSSDGLNWTLREGPASQYFVSWRKEFPNFTSAEFALKFLKTMDEGARLVALAKRNFVPMEPKYY
jgi:hypothetical protein